MSENKHISKLSPTKQNDISVRQRSADTGLGCLKMGFKDGVGC